LERAKHFAGLASWPKHPHSNEDGEEAEDMKDQDCALNQGELSREQCVEDYREACDRDDQERTVPSFRDVGWVIEDDETLYLSTGQESDRRDTCLPS
jgi:hypothetical protein